MKKKILFWLTVGSVILTTLVVGALPSKQIVQESYGTDKTREFTHTVFAEDGTATWCGPCVYAHDALDAIYSAGWYPFYYVTLVNDRNSHAHDRIFYDYNATAYPTVWFDGGDQVVLGAGSVPKTMTKYNTSILACGQRPVPDITTTLNVTWLGDATMDITATVRNDESTPYAGHIRVYVTEIKSSLGWIDAAGKPYTFPLLDYAFNQDITIGASNTWNATTRWNGNNFNNGNGQDFGRIKLGNIMVIAAVSNATRHTGYSKPPNDDPFDAYYVDDATGFFVGNNNRPDTPKINGPAKGRAGISYTYNFYATDSNKDTLYFFIDWGDNNSSGWVGPYPQARSIPFPHTWSTDGTYTIRAKVKDKYGAESDWGTATVQMPLGTTSSFLFYQRMLHRIPFFEHLISSHPLFSD